MRQIKCYMSLLGADYGKLLYILEGTLPKTITDPFIEYLITWNYANEPADIIKRLEAGAAELQKGIDQNNPDVVGYIFNNPEYIKFGNNWMCNRCEYRAPCDVMRASEFAERWLATSIKQSIISGANVL